MPHSNELTRSKCYEIFSQSTGVEIRSAAKNHEERGVVVERSGRIQLRFFKLTPKTNPDDITQIRFVCEPDEAFELFHKISSVAALPQLHARKNSIPTSSRRENRRLKPSLHLPLKNGSVTARAATP